MFFVRPAGTRVPEQRSTCSKCASPHSPGQNFCTKCGWDLSSEYSADTADTVLASEMHQTQSTSTATLERPVETPSHDSFGAPSPAPEENQSSSAEDNYDAQTAPVEPAAEGASVFAPEESQPEEAQRPWGMPVPGPAPTAEGMTARGELLLSEGKLQEAIDQFTKAIALDPRHREAFEKRAEAYTRQGRQERAEEDYRQVRALNTGS